MRRKLLLAFALVCCALWAQAQGPEVGVVRIEANFGSKVKVSSGFCYSQSTYVVTALHGVGGSSKITVYSQSRKKQTEAKIVKVLLEADLALLQLDSDIGLSALPVASTSHNSTDDYTVIGYPRGVPTLQGDRIRFSQTYGGHPVLKDVVGNKISELLGTQGYPSPGAKIYRVSDIIQPGNSGSPVMNRSNQVVAIADGGLHKGVSRLNWAMPTSYLTDLMNSTESIYVKRADGGNLYSEAATIDADKVDEQASSVGSGESEIVFVETMALGDVFDTMDEETIAAFLQHFAQGIQGTTLDEVVALIEQSYYKEVDVYENYAADMVIVVPSAFSLDTSEENQYTVASPDQNIDMTVLLYPSDSYDHAYAMIAPVYDALEGDFLASTDSYTWQETSEARVVEDYPDSQYHIENRLYYRYDASGEPEQELMSRSIVSGESYMLAALHAKVDPHAYDEDYYISNYYLPLICMELGTFFNH